MYSPSGNVHYKITICEGEQPFNLQIRQYFCSKLVVFSLGAILTKLQYKSEEKVISPSSSTIVHKKRGTDRKSTLTPKQVLRVTLLTLTKC